MIDRKHHTMELITDNYFRNAFLTLKRNKLPPADSQLIGNLGYKLSVAPCNRTRDPSMGWKVTHLFYREY